MTPLVFDIFCGLGGWAEGFLAEGYDVVGFDIERHAYPDGTGYPGQLVLQDATTINGAQLKDATIIVASPPCQEFSYSGMPWKRAKAQVPEVLPDYWTKSEAEMTPEESLEWHRWRAENPANVPGTGLFEACFRVQREASEAAGRHIPMVVENVCGAQKWVGEAQARYGSYYLWGDIAMVGKKLVALVPGRPLTDGLLGLRTTTAPQKFNPDGTQHGQGSWFAVADSNDRGSRKFQAHCGPRLWKDRDVPRLNDGESLLKEGFKSTGMNWSDRSKHGQDFTHVAGQQATKNNGGSWFAVAHNTESGHSRNPVNGVKGYAARLGETEWSRHLSRSAARKHASALIAKIPFPLAQHIARTFKPRP